MNKEIEIPEGYEARIEGNKVIIAQKESEDERIRKELVNFVAKVKDIAKSGRDSWAVRKEDVEMCERFLAYLEKQKEQKDWAEELNTKIKELHKQCLAQLKPAEWSERHIADIFEKVGLAKIAREQGNDKLTNALQDAMLELSKVENAEWSEEDEWKRNELLKYLEEKGDYRSTWYSWLKSLRPQPHWKPSEEQVSILGKVFAGCELNTTERDSMVDLFYHLKDMI